MGLACPFLAPRVAVVGLVAVGVAALATLLERPPAASLGFERDGDVVAAIEPPLAHATARDASLDSLAAGGRRRPGLPLRVAEALATTDGGPVVGVLRVRGPAPREGQGTLLVLDGWGHGKTKLWLPFGDAGEARLDVVREGTFQVTAARAAASGGWDVSVRGDVPRLSVAAVEMGNHGWTAYGTPTVWTPARGNLDVPTWTSETSLAVAVERDGPPVPCAVVRVEIERRTVAYLTTSYAKGPGELPVTPRVLVPAGATVRAALVRWFGSSDEAAPTPIELRTVEGCAATATIRLPPAATVTVSTRTRDGKPWLCPLRLARIGADGRETPIRGDEPYLLGEHCADRTLPLPAGRYRIAAGPADGQGLGCSLVDVAPGGASKVVVMPSAENSRVVVEWTEQRVEPFRGYVRLRAAAPRSFEEDVTDGACLDAFQQARLAVPRGGYFLTCGLWVRRVWVGGDTALRDRTPDLSPDARSLVGVVRAPASIAYGELNVVAEPEGGGWGRCARWVEADGRFEIDGLEPGAYRVHAFGRDRPPGADSRAVCVKVAEKGPPPAVELDLR